MIELKSEVDLFGAYGWAVFSDDMRHRVELGRIWEPKLPLCNGLFMNPSTANHLELDRTTNAFRRRCVKKGFGGFIVTNINAFVETKQDLISKVDDPVGEGNDDAIASAADRCKIVLCGWGAKDWSKDRAASVLATLQATFPEKLHVLKLNEDGSPRHPLYIAMDAPMVPWSPGVST